MIQAHHKAGMPNLLKSSLTAIGVLGLLAVPVASFAAATQPLPDAAAAETPADAPIADDDLDAAIIRTSQLTEASITTTTETSGTLGASLTVRLDGDNWQATVAGSDQPRPDVIVVDDVIVVVDEVIVVDDVMYLLVDEAWSAAPMLAEFDSEPALREMLASTELLVALPLLDLGGSGTHRYALDCATLPTGSAPGPWTNECESGSESEFAVDPDLGLLTRITRRITVESDMGVLTQTVVTTDIDPSPADSRITAPANPDWSGYRCLATKLGADPDDPAAMNTAVAGMSADSVLELSLTCP